MGKSKPKRDEEREDRIRMEIIVDAYGPEEQAVGWYCYLDGQMEFPFTATCIAKRSISPLRIKDEVEVIGLADEGECEHEMFAMIRWDRREGLAVPLSQLEPIDETAEETRRAIEDWHYWVRMGYEF